MNNLGHKSKLFKLSTAIMTTNSDIFTCNYMLLIYIT